ncbi:MAG: hypothetical protein KA479_08060 [Saprospiraceae bacterium]|nr:hypothetical protein [Saprospiraceae bacterium]
MLTETTNLESQNMENVVREDLDQLNAVLTVQVPMNVYKPIFETKLKDFKRKAQIKGFRKGHTPEGFVKRMYGQSILAEVVQEEINKNLQAYLLEHKPTFFGEPIISESQEPMEFDLAHLHDYTVRFDLGLVPEFELKGFDQSTTLLLPQVNFSESEIDDQVNNLLRKHGDRAELTEGQVEHMDFVELHLEEWENGEKKQGGIHTHSSFLVSDQMTPYMRDLMLGKSIKDTFVFDPYQSEVSTSREGVRKYILRLEENAPETSNEFFARIDKITRVTPALLDDAFFKKAYGPDTDMNEATLRETIRKNLSDTYAQHGGDYIMAHMKISLLDANPLPLPEGFLRRWVTTADLDDKDPEEWTEEKFRRFFLDLRWTLIRDKIIERKNLQVSNEEVVAAYKEKLVGYFGGNPDPAMMDALAPRVLEDKEMISKISEQIIQDKLAEAYKEEVTIQQEPLTIETYKNWIEEAFDKLNQQFNSL